MKKIEGSRLSKKSSKKLRLNYKDSVNWSLNNKRENSNNSSKKGMIAKIETEINREQQVVAKMLRELLHLTELNNWVH